MVSYRAINTLCLPLHGIFEYMQLSRPNWPTQQNLSPTTRRLPVTILGNSTKVQGISEVNISVRDFLYKLIHPQAKDE
jgi:hypothetical protein